MGGPKHFIHTNYNKTIILLKYIYCPVLNFQLKKQKVFLREPFNLGLTLVNFLTKA